MAVITGTSVTLAFVGETTHGTTPATPVFSVLRATGRNVNLKKDLLESAEVKASRQRGDVRHGFNRVEGEIGVELALQAYNPLILWAMSGAFSGVNPTWDQPVATASVTFATPGGSGSSQTILMTKAATNWYDQGYRPGDWLRFTGFVTSTQNNADFRVSTISSDGLTATLATGSVTAGAEAGGTATYIGRRCSINNINGTKLKTFTLEREFLDASNPVYEVFKGCSVNTMNISMRPESLLTATFGILGMSAILDSTATLDSSGVYTPAPTNPPLAGVDAQGYYGQFPLTTTGFDMTLDNQRTLFGTLGSKFSPDVFEGVAKVTGNVNFVFSQQARLTDFANETSFPYSIRINEVGTSDFISISFYRMKLLGADVEPPTNGPCIINSPFEALEQSFVGSTTTFKEVMHIQRSTTTNVTTATQSAFPDA